MEAAAASRTTLCALPLALLQNVLARLPVDARARACKVRRAWKVALAERSLWTRLDLSAASGVAVAVTDTVLRGAAARAGGQLEALDLNGCDNVTYAEVLAVVTACGPTLRELRWCGSLNTVETRDLDSHKVDALLRAAPQLRVFDADVCSNSTAEASLLLRGEPPFEPFAPSFARGVLRVRALSVNDRPEHPVEAAVLALVAAVAGHAWLAALDLANMPLNTEVALDALVDAALARRLRAVELWACELTPASAPALARLLGGGLSRLAIIDMSLDLPAALLLSHALRACTTLTSFQLGHAELWDDPAAAVLLLNALTGHRSLRELDLTVENAANTPAEQAVAGASLSAVIGANAPALRTLAVTNCNLGDIGMGALVDALARNTHLRTLLCAGNAISEDFARNRLRPAVEMNDSLRNLGSEPHCRTVANE
jgi:hypothetical protein